MPSSPTSPTIAIVGGGPGGLFAAYILNQKLPDATVTIFESSDRLAGKILTDHFDDGTPFEAGVAELYEYLGPGGKDPLRQLIEDDLGLPTVDMTGGAVVLGNEILRNLDEVEEVHGKPTRVCIEEFHKLMVELMPLEMYAHRWQPDNSHPWANKTFRECVREACPDNPIACAYIEAAVHSDLATEPHTCNGLNGIKNVLMDNKKYMQLYHVKGGIGRVGEQLAGLVEAEVRLNTRVTGVTKKEDTYLVCSQGTGEEPGPALEESFDVVIVAIPNHWLCQIRWGDAQLCEAMHKVEAHYDLPAHYLRITLLYEAPWWEKLRIPGDYWMMDVFNGCCCYNESHRWRSTRGHVLSFLLGGQDALLLGSQNWTDEEIVHALLDRLPECMCEEAEDFLDARVDFYLGSINAQPGGWPAEELRAEHVPEPRGHPGVYLVGDYFFDSTLNAALISAHTAVACLLEHLGVEGEKTTKAIEQLEPDGASLSLWARRLAANG